MIQASCHVELELSVRQASGDVGPDNLYGLAEAHERARALRPALETFLASGQEPPPRLVTALVSSNNALSSDRIVRLLVTALVAYADCSVHDGLRLWAEQSLEELFRDTALQSAHGFEEGPPEEPIASIDDLLGRHSTGTDSGGAQATAMWEQSNAAVKEALHWLRSASSPGACGINENMQSRVALCAALWNAKTWTCDDDGVVLSLLSDLCSCFQMKLPGPAPMSEWSPQHRHFVAGWLGEMRTLSADVQLWMQGMLSSPHQCIDQVLPFPATSERPSEMSLYAAHPHLHATINQMINCELLRTGHPALLRLIAFLNSAAFLARTVHCQVGAPSSDLALILGAPAPLKSAVEILAGRTSLTAASEVHAAIDKARRAGPDIAMQVWLLAVKFPVWQVDAMFSIFAFRSFSPAAVDFLLWVWAPLQDGDSTQQVRKALGAVRNRCNQTITAATLCSIKDHVTVVHSYGGAGTRLCIAMASALRKVGSAGNLKAAWEALVSDPSDDGAFTDSAWKLSEILDTLDSIYEWLRLRLYTELETRLEHAMPSIFASACRLFIEDLHRVQSKFPTEAPYFAGMLGRSNFLLVGAASLGSFGQSSAPLPF